nr:UvrD-helicase domain-containing protein [Hyphomicrobium methylovorum]
MPWEQWAIFLHPSQRAFVTRTFSGPARVAGSAGTGKTVVAVHRAARLAASNDRTRVLLTTFSEPLAASLERKVKVLAGDAGSVVPRITVASFVGIARDLYQLVHGRSPQIASEDLVHGLLTKAAAAEPGPPINERFLLSEWKHVVDAWQLKSAEGYADVPRLGRKNRMGKKQRDRLWPVFAHVIHELNARGFVTEAGVFQSVTDHYAAKAEKPFHHIVVDEAQDLGVPELRFLIAIAPAGTDALFFAGDLGQRIFQQPFSWKALGVNVTGRSTTLKVNYRTSHQIRETADRLLPGAVVDVDGRDEERKGTVSVFNGPVPIVVAAADAAAEQTAVAKFIDAALADGVLPEEIGVFVRTREVMSRARAAVNATGRDVSEITLHRIGGVGTVRIGVMHLAKGLEFKVVAVMACDDDVLPLKARLEAVADETELDDVFDTERQLFYVACTRARDRLMVSGVKPGSQFMSDLMR